VHFVEESRTLAEKFLPGWILQRIAARFGAGVQAGIRPDVANFIGSTRLGLPEPDNP
jgi:hypothetical protein